MLTAGWWDSDAARAAGNHRYLKITPAPLRIWDLQRELSLIFANGREFMMKKLTWALGLAVAGMVCAQDLPLPESRSFRQFFHRQKAPV